MPVSNLAALNICFLAGTLGQGGAERQLFYILKTLRECGAHPWLLSLTRGEHWEAPIRSLGVPVTCVGQGRRLQRIWHILAETRRRLPEIIQSQHFYTNLYAVAAARAIGKREIGALRSATVNEVQSHALTGKCSLKAPRQMAANSRAAINTAIEFGVATERLFLLPNVVDTGIFTPKPHRNTGPVVLLAAGRLSEEKRLDRFLELIARLRQDAGQAVKGSAVKGPVVKGLIVGDGPQREQLQNRAAAMNLSPEVVEFRGSTDHMADIYAESDVLVLTSDWEGTPNVILEAMACGLPVAAAKVGGVPEIVEHRETGFLAGMEDETLLLEQMTAHLKLLIADPQLRLEMGRAGRVKIEMNYSLATLPHYLSEIYKLVLA